MHCANFVHARKFAQREFFYLHKVALLPILFRPELSHPNSVLGNFGIVGNLREFRIQIYLESTLLKL